MMRAPRHRPAHVVCWQRQPDVITHGIPRYFLICQFHHGPLANRPMDSAIMSDHTLANSDAERSSPQGSPSVLLVSGHFISEPRHQFPFESTIRFAMPQISNANPN